MKNRPPSPKENRAGRCAAVEAPHDQPGILEGLGGVDPLSAVADLEHRATVRFLVAVSFALRRNLAKSSFVRQPRAGSLLVA
jgi:hypothetical protein